VLISTSSGICKIKGKVNKKKSGRLTMKFKLPWAEISVAVDIGILMYTADFVFCHLNRRGTKLAEHFLLQINKKPR